MSGIINSAGSKSGIIGAYPSGNIVQVKYHLVANSGNTSTAAWHHPNTALGFDNPLQSTNSKVIFSACASCKKVTGGTGSWLEAYMVGGGLGGTTSGVHVCNSILYNLANLVRENYSATVIDIAPGSLTPTYRIYLQNGGSNEVDITLQQFVLQEIAG